MLPFVLSFAAIYLIWGSTYLAIKFAVVTIPPFLMLSFRFLPAGLIMYGGPAAQGRGAARRPPVAGGRRGRAP